MRLLISVDYRDVVVVPADLELERVGAGLYRMPDEVLP